MGSLRRSTRTAALAIVILNLLDLATTYYVLSHGGLELNPISKFLIDTHLLIPAKVLVVGTVVYGAFRTPTTVVKNSALWFVTGLYTLTIALNTLHVVGYTP